MMMEREKIIQTSEDIVYLIGCVLHEIAPDEKRVANMDLEHLYQISEFHTVVAMICMALEKTNIFAQIDGKLKSKWKEVKNKAIRKNILLDAERRKIFSWMEEKKIWHMPLKGSILKDFYPEIGMRQMADNDILFDEMYRQDVWNYMTHNGYEATRGINDDVYKKPPIYHFELHRSLFSFSYSSKWAKYYENIKKRLILVENTLCEYRFTDEDFYIYMMAHEYKHYDNGGTGIRSLLDCYIYNREKGSKLDWEYIKTELEQLEIWEFESEMRSLSEKLFSHPNEILLKTLTQRERKVFEYCIFSGAYGTSQNWVRKNLERMNTKGETVSARTKRIYLLRRLFPKKKEMIEWCQLNCPVFIKRRGLLGIAYIWRVIQSIVKRHRQVLREIGIVLRIK